MTRATLPDGGIELVGARELNELLRKFPGRVAFAARKAGVRKAAAKMRTYLRRGAPKGTGTFRKALGIKIGKYGNAYVGLRERYYYKTLEFGRRGGPPLHPFFLATVERHKAEIAQMMVDEARKALYREAGKAFAQSLRVR
jgi:hypothetical protein